MKSVDNHTKYNATDLCTANTSQTGLFNYKPLEMQG